MCCSVYCLGECKDNVKICNVHYVVYAFVGVTSSTILMHRMNNSKPVILNLYYMLFIKIMEPG